MATNNENNRTLLQLVSEDTDSQDSDEFQFKLLIPSLKDVAGAKLVLALWSQKFTETPSRPFNCSKIRELISEVYGLLFQMRILYSYKRKLFRLNEQIAKELFTFCQHLMYNFEFRNISWCEFDDIIWHPRGTINYARTIEMVITCPTISRKKRDAIACVYGFVDKLSQQLSELYVSRDKRNLYDKFFVTNHVLLDDQHPVMMNYWESKEDDERMKSINAWMEMDLKCHRLQDICFLLAKLSGAMLQRVLLTWEDQLLEIFSNDLFHDDYFWQIAILMTKITDEKCVPLNTELTVFCDSEMFVLQNVPLK